jgi:diguanylate cyclase (GGDEF)-like protein
MFSPHIPDPAPSAIDSITAELSDDQPAAPASAAIEFELFRHALRNHRAGLVVNILAALGVAWMAQDGLGSLAWAWLALNFALSALRWAADRLLNARLQLSPQEHGQPALLPRRLFEAGFIGSASLWAILLLFGLPYLEIAAQFTVVVVVSALAGGATGVLAPLRTLGRVYILLLLLPGSAALMMLDPPQWVLAILACVFAVVMLVGHRNNHALLVSSLQLQHQNDWLLRRLSESNQEIRRSNVDLEQRVEERTSALRDMSQRDALTGLLNRRGLIEVLQPRDSAGAHLAVLFLDLDRFKQVNDGLGHEAGDGVLRDVALRFAQAAPAQAVLARWGGDEFVLVWPAADALCGQVVELGTRMQAALIAPIELGEERVQLGVSIGYTCRSGRGESCAELIAAADLAAADAKRRGRGLAVAFEPRLAELQQRRLQVVSGLRTAVEDKALWLAYQPIVQAGTHALHSVEALMRWNSPRLGAVAPDEFIAIAEDSDRIQQLGDWALRRALADAVAAGSAAPPQICVNVSLRQLAWDGFYPAVVRALDASGFAPQRLVLEVTESVFEERGSQRTLTSLRALAALGIRIHVDDFGAGYSSLGSLHSFPLHAIKIDRCFVARLDLQACAIIEAAVLIAQGHGLEVIAEGVETAEQARVLHGIGVNALQGYFFGRPEAGLGRWSSAAR